MTKSLRRLFGMLIIVAAVVATNRVSAAGVGNHVDIVDCSNNWQVFFRLGSSDVDLDFEGNRQMLADIIEKLEQIDADPTTELEGLKILGYASPEGTVEFNQKLSEQRAEAVMVYLLDNSSISAEHFEIQGMGENWDELVDLLAVSDWDKAPQLINIIKYSRGNIDRELEIIRIAGEDVYLEMKDRYFDQLRSAASFEAFSLKPAPTPEPEPEVEPEPEPEPEPEVVPEPEKVMVMQPEQDKDHKFRLGVSTNIIYWAARITPNIDIEAYIGDQYAVSVSGVHRWRDEISAITDDMSLWSATGEVKRWFKDDNKFEGWNMGAYGRYGEYDILLPDFLNETDDDWRQGKNYGGGLSVGYTLKLLKNCPLYADFGLFLGYDRLKYDVYYEYEDEFEKCNAFKYHVERNSYGLKRLEASILWRF